ncbi:PucR family transcriptional regulator [Neobacillus mesonae]|uniref:PucR family transcriptional regulator n=1 Tax=Neobacillus mesonae TaxID=1193713 RepID=UPI00203E9C80|nr:PucR family transcriptional regulator [Neobacillus mesonae]MCM3570831.1 PucR family transcriptional regulator [Neobacillus mesonae]
MMTVKDFLQLSVTKDFSVVAGDNALNKPIQSVEILDFEFAAGIQQVRETAFNPHSIVLSSLLFAKEKPELLLNTVRNLIDLKVSALAYKPVIFKDLPQEVLDVANEQHFPILCFGGDEFFEDIIFEAMSQLKKADKRCLLEKIMQTLVDEEVSEEQIQSFIKQMGTPFEEHVVAANIQLKQPEKDSKWRESFFQLEGFLKSGLVCTYKQSIFVFYTEKNSQFQFEKMLKEWLKLNAIPAEPFTMGFSQVHKTMSELQLAVREAYYACVFGKIELDPICYYDQLASERLLIELYRRDAQFANHYVETYLGPIIRDPELLNTAVTFVKRKGNVKEAADTLHCHPNTIRYRMTKIRQLIAPSQNELVFYEHVSAAVKLYLLHKESTNVLE